MTDPTQAGQPTEAELRAYLEQLRGADPGEVLVQAYRMLGTGAEVKLGRADARVLIDAMAGMVQAVEGRVDAELTKQMRDGVGQLQTAQVQAERDTAGQDTAAATQPEQRPGAGEQATPESRAAPAPDRPAGQQQTAQDAAGQRMTDRLWIPGRDPGPR